MSRYVLFLVVAMFSASVAFASGSKINRVDINSATEAQLKSIPGITKESAAKIIAGRPYAKKEELKSKNIISADSYNKIKMLIDSIC